jgi:hypothetical protein
MVEILLVNFYVYSNVVAILLPCYHWLILYEVNHKVTLIHSSPKHCRIHSHIFFPVGLQTDQESYTLVCMHQISHRSVGKKKIHFFTLVDLQLDAQNSCLFTYNTFIKILYMFRALPCSSSGGLRRNCIYVASGIVTLCRWLSCAPVKKVLEQFFLNRCTGQSPAESDDTRGHIYTITT